MNQAPPRRLFTLFLGVFLTLGIGLATVLAAGMAGKMTVVATAATVGGDGCSGCGGGAADDGAGPCHSACTIADLPSRPSAPVPAVAMIERALMLADLAFTGHPTAPDPSPPKASVRN